MLLEGKKVVVIGGSSGIGLAIACQARAQGASLVILGRDPVKVSDAVSMLGGDTQGVVGDAHDHSALEEFVGALPDCDHLVSMIGDTMAGGFLETPLETMRHVLHSKFWTNLLIARCAAPLIRDGGSMTFDLGKRRPGAGGGGELCGKPGACRHGARTGFGTCSQRACERRRAGVHGHGLVAREAT